MTSHKKFAYLILLSTLTLSSAAPMQAQQRWNTPRQSYTPPPAPRQFERPEPQREQQRYEPETRQYNNFRSDSRSDSGLGRSNVNVSRPRRTINPDYFAGHFGRGQEFHFNGWGPGCPTCGFTVFNGERYFNFNGATFGVTTPIPGYWALGSDYLYVDTGDDGNYYLYDTQFPGAAVQLTFVQNLGDDQGQGDGSDE